MANSMVDNVCEEQVSRLMEDPGWMSTLAEIVKNLRSGFYDQSVQNVIFQKWDRFPIDFNDAFPFIDTWGDLCLAKIVAARIYVGRGPANDKEVAINDAILKTLRPPFSGYFDGGVNGSDGFIDVRGKVEFDMRNLKTNERKTAKVGGRFPLEAGYISAAKTMMYLSSPGGRRLARWPYDSEEIWLLYRISE